MTQQERENAQEVAIKELLSATLLSMLKRIDWEAVLAAGTDGGASLFDEEGALAGDGGGWISKAVEANAG